ncbi:MAG TPA: hypothetical protein QF861_06030 [Alphaproteobacteria bacterium]|nr:hypothetical protein [Alphaproteobacteria bacterium]
MPTRPAELAPWLYATAYAATVIDALHHIAALMAVAKLAVALFVVIEFRRVPLIPRLVGALLMALGLAAALMTGAGATTTAVTALWDGLGRTLPFLVLFGAVAWLQVPAGESPSLGAIRDMVVAQPPGRRFAFLGTAAHLLGMAFNLAGISLLSSMVSHQEDRRLRRRLGRAMAQGFATSTCWSPFFVGAAVILALLPAVAWLEVAPFGIALGAILVFLSWLIDRLGQPRRAAAPPVSPGAGVPARAWRGTASVLVLLFAGTMALVEGFDFSIPIALGLVAPPLALAWRGRIAGPGRALASKGDLARQVVGAFASLRSEAVLFLGANVMGAGIAATLDPGAVAAALAASGLGSDAIVMMLAWVFLLAAALGLHPVIIGTLILTTLTPADLGLRPELLALMLMALWGLGTNVSPVSATVLYLSRLTGENNLTVAWV